ncbi:archaeal proteasome endopeptidase complex subunit beta [Haloferax mediterranei ATCC 33500]|uniref:Proteasome subunit beta n=1 Tax=Haloferax mediterranei (strain ATCC 33500 / DSM 1411 / JCM 8866 / NBRC 14739 / NCIMB 2177 / R-4) TaxID=523841 RepID=I3R519_HALMT|nr:archaeal proteasome endopeptidase complex subunit beta [Haloferax mediterranei]AFK19329.1 proteasome beta subunit [Haloferax mediterranei ATCC 33500]AHZ21316.1 proteasome subunit beta [Haloferax mediterranei ATCC 33500]EMA04481.1 proteasome beta subunit [Haloferax mediterranei ATCC 33500]MDX5989433.1 archaeal proteasome endopeptidase complex subunit beta [Haloferax mediterranei ATCC 33500]QCQ75797.1 archaeal proteasome endopeptidase complex subunit beta [Haloferax mediterranei ATCC 33500]
MRTPTHDEFSSRLDSLNGDHSNVFGPELGEFPHAERRADSLGDKETKTGTTTVGIKTDEGVVLATDMRASLGHMVSSKDVQKVEEIHPRGALTIAGSVSAAQSLISSLRAEVRLYESRRGEDMSMQALSTLVGNFLRSGGFYIVQPILGGVDDEGAHIYSIDPAGSILEEEYTVTGSGSQYALGVLEQEFSEDLSIDEAREVATKAIRSAVERDLASGNGINIAVVTEDGVDIQRHENFEGLDFE